MTESSATPGEDRTGGGHELTLDAGDHASSLTSIATGYRLSQVLFVFAELDLAGALAKGPADLASLAAGSGAHAPSLLRLLRVCERLGLVDELPRRRFGLTARGQLLRSDIERSMAPRARSIGQPSQWQSWGELLHAVKGGEPVFAERYGSNSFDYYDRTPGAGDTLTSRMTVEASERGARLAEAFDFTGVHCVVDVGGGQGGVVGAVLRRFPHLQGILLDLPYAVAGAEEVLGRLGVADRCRIVAGDFRHGVPAGGDLYLLSAILHSWNDADSIRLLEECFSHADRVVVLDEVIGDDDRSLELLVKDLQLMIFTEGRQRTIGEFRSLFRRAGADLVRQIPTSSREVVMEGVATAAGFGT